VLRDDGGGGHAGMTAAAIVAGNTFILKPSSDSPTIAARFVEVLEEAGLPDGVVNFCPGSAPLSATPSSSTETRFIAFTGSKAVGLEFMNAQPSATGQIWIKRTILERAARTLSCLRHADLDAANDGVSLGLRFQRPEVLRMLSRHH